MRTRIRKVTNSDRSMWYYPESEVSEGVWEPVLICTAHDSIGSAKEAVDFFLIPTPVVVKTEYFTYPPEG